ncbi:hypothetical protein TNCV_2114141 [Trichonephila clavipes]|nr:hypothetical protein TNCV_2114141 [Trichonephila clavipes]
MEKILGYPLCCIFPPGATAYELRHSSINRQVANVVTKMMLTWLHCHVSIKSHYNSTTSGAKHRRMSERGETDSRSIGSSDKFRATAVRRNVVNHQTRLMMAQRRQLDIFTKGRIVGMLESSRSQTEEPRILNVD